MGLFKRLLGDSNSNQEQSFGSKKGTKPELENLEGRLVPATMMIRDNLDNKGEVYELVKITPGGDEAILYEGRSLSDSIYDLSVAAANNGDVFIAISQGKYNYDPETESYIYFDNSVIKRWDAHKGTVLEFDNISISDSSATKPVKLDLALGADGNLVLATRHTSGTAAYSELRLISPDGNQIQPLYNNAGFDGSTYGGDIASVAVAANGDIAFAFDNFYDEGVRVQLIRTNDPDPVTVNLIPKTEMTNPLSLDLAFGKDGKLSEALTMDSNGTDTKRILSVDLSTGAARTTYFGGLNSQNFYGGGDATISPMETGDLVFAFDDGFDGSKNIVSMVAKNRTGIGSLPARTDILDISSPRNPTYQIDWSSNLDWTVNIAGYKNQITVSGAKGTVSYATISGKLPAGLTLDSKTGVITGKPTAQGVFQFTIQAVDSSKKTATKSFTITIYKAVSFKTLTLPDVATGEVYDSVVESLDGTGDKTFTVASGKLPPGLYFTADGRIGGYPSLAGNYSFQIKVEDSSKSTSVKTYNINVLPAQAMTLEEKLIRPSASKNLYLKQFFGGESVNIPLTLYNMASTALKGSLEVQFYLSLQPDFIDATSVKLGTAIKKTVSINAGKVDTSSFVLANGVIPKNLKFGSEDAFGRYVYIIGKVVSSTVSGISKDDQVSHESGFTYLGTPVNSSAFTDGTFFAFAARAVSYDFSIISKGLGDKSNLYGFEYAKAVEGINAHTYVDNSGSIKIGVGVVLDDLDQGEKAQLVELVRVYYLKNYPNENLPETDNDVIALLKSQSGKKKAVISAADITAFSLAFYQKHYNAFTDDDYYSRNDLLVDSLRTYRRLENLTIFGEQDQSFDYYYRTSAVKAFLLLDDALVAKSKSSTLAMARIEYQFRDLMMFASGGQGELFS